MSTVKALSLSDYMHKRKKSDKNFMALQLADELGISKQLLNWHLKSGSLIVVQGNERRLYKLSRLVQD